MIRNSSLLITFFSVLSILISSCSSDAGIKEIILEASLNPSLQEDVVLTIKNDTISGEIPLSADIQNLIPTINSNATRIVVNGKEVKNGITKMDFAVRSKVDVYDKNGKTKSFILNTKFFNGLPIVTLFTENQIPITSRESYLDGQIKIIGDTPHSQFNIMKVRGRGNTSWGYPKRSYQFKFKDKIGLLGMNPGKKWLLISNISDKTMLRNKLAYELSDISRLSWRTNDRFVDLFINNDYRGTYQLTEKLEESVDRLDIGEDGVLIEADTPIKYKPGDITFRTNKEMFKIKEPKVNKDDAVYNAIKRYLILAEDALFSKNFTDPDKGYRKYFDMPSFVDWYIINEIAKCNDAIFHTSVHLHYKKGEKINMGPVWDYDISFGNINYSDNEKIEGFWVNKARWYNRLFKDPYFVEEVKERYPYFYMQKSKLLESLDKYADDIRLSQDANFKKWPIMGKEIWPNPVVFDTYQEEVDYLKNWLSDRMDWLDQAFKEM